MALLYELLIFLGDFLLIDRPLQLRFFLVKAPGQTAGPEMHFFHKFIENVMFDLFALTSLLRLVNVTPVFAHDQIRLFFNRVGSRFQVRFSENEEDGYDGGLEGNHFNPEPLNHITIVFGEA